MYIACIRSRQRVDLYMYQGTFLKLFCMRVLKFLILDALIHLVNSREVSDLRGDMSPFHPPVLLGRRCICRDLESSHFFLHEGLCHTR